MIKFVTVECVATDSPGTEGGTRGRGPSVSFSDLLTSIVNHNNLSLSGLGEEYAQQLEVFS
jgi:hypothetical protein